MQHHYEGFPSKMITQTNVNAIDKTAGGDAGDEKFFQTNNYHSAIIMEAAARGP